MSDVTITITLPAELVERATALGLELEAESFARVWADALQLQVQLAEAVTRTAAIDPSVKNFVNSPPGEQLHLLMYELRGRIASIEAFSEILRMHHKGQSLKDGQVEEISGTIARITREIVDALQRYGDVIRVGPPKIL
jgi:hypothetical protein